VSRDLGALRRLYQHLEAGGTLLLDNEVPYSDAHRWQYWLEDGQVQLPVEWGPPPPLRRGSDGAEYRLNARVTALDRLDQCLRLQMRAEVWRNGEQVAEEEHSLTMRVYFKDELVLMLEHVGFQPIEVRGGYTDDQASGEHKTLVFIARKAPGVDDL
jgi:hypothetical protein